MSKLALPIVESVLKLYRALGARTAELSEEPDSAESARADAAIAALDFLREERAARLLTTDVFDDETKEKTDQWRKRVQDRIDASIVKIEEVDDEGEKSYLYSVLFNAILDLSSTKRDFLFKESIEKIFDLLDDSDRELTAYPYALYLARRLPYLPIEGIEQTRMAVGQLCEELGDQLEYEHVMSAMALGTAVGLERLDRSDDRVNDLFSASLTDYSAIETEEGAYRHYSQTFSEIVDLLADESLAPYYRENYAGMKALMQGVEESLATGKRSKQGRPGADEDEDEALEEDELYELRELAAEFEVDNPCALKDGEFLRGFVTRNRAFGVVDKTLARAKDALDTVDAAPDDPAFARNRAIYKSERSAYEAELDAWLDLARTAFPAAETDPRDKALMLARLARLEFLYGDEERGKDRVREALAIVSRLEPPEAVDVYTALVHTHAEAKKIKPARRLTESLADVVDKFDAPVMADHYKSRLFPLFIRFFDDARLADELESFDSPAESRRWAANCAVVSAFKDYQESGDAAAFDDDFTRIAEQRIDENQGEDPVIAATALRQLAEFVAMRFEKLAKQADK